MIPIWIKNECTEHEDWSKKNQDVFYKYLISSAKFLTEGLLFSSLVQLGYSINYQCAHYEIELHYDKANG